MKISMKEHGGYGAPLNRPPKLVDTDLLPADAAAEGKRLAAAAQAADADAHAHAEPSRAPEAMTYTVTVEEDGQAGTFRLSDAALGPEGIALLDWFQRHAG